MAKLSNYRIRKETVDLGDGNAVEVRGLSLIDLQQTFDAHRLDMESLYEGLMSGTISPEAKAETLLSVIKQFPSLVAMLIACACDEPEETTVVLTMPIPDQMALADSILKLTMKDGLLLKKWQEMAAKVEDQTAAAKQMIRQ